MTDLTNTAHQLMHAGRGLLAADETIPHADKYLVAHGIDAGEEMRREFRDLLLDTPGIEEYLSGVILYQETLSQSGNDHVGFPQHLREHDILPGIKVDQGLEPMPNSPEETITSGLIGLHERLEEFRTKYGTEFTKWRAAIAIEGDRLPTTSAIVENSKRLALYALEAQKVHMVPIVEPEVLLKGDHSRMRAKEVLRETLYTLFIALHDQGVDLSALILKTSMVLSGSESGKKDTPEEVGVDTMEVLMDTVPAETAGIVFLSGGQTPEQATENLHAIMKCAKERGAPWPLTYSFARAFQEEAISVWGGKLSQVAAARDTYMSRLKKASEALRG